MHKNFLFQSFLLILFAITLWYTGKATYRYHTYSKLTAQVVPTQVDWSIEEISTDDYILVANYTYNISGTDYKGSTAFSKEPYRNPYAAEQYKKERVMQSWVVWYDPSTPHHSSLQKEFPLKECLTAIFMWGLLLYFLWISFYVTKFKT